MWWQHVPNSELYDNLLFISAYCANKINDDDDKVAARRMGLVGLCSWHPELPAGNVILWEPILFLFGGMIVLIVHIWPNSKDPLFSTTLFNHLSWLESVNRQRELQREIPITSTLQPKTVKIWRVGGLHAVPSLDTLSNPYLDIIGKLHLKHTRIYDALKDYTQNCSNSATLTKES